MTFKRKNYLKKMKVFIGFAVLLVVATVKKTFRLFKEWFVDKFLLGPARRAGKNKKDSRTCLSL